jgi:hypothetical protein
MRPPQFPDTIWRKISVEGGPADHVTDERIVFVSGRDNQWNEKRSFKVYRNVLKIRFCSLYQYDVNSVEKQRDLGTMTEDRFNGVSQHGA